MVHKWAKKNFVSDKLLQKAIENVTNKLGVSNLSNGF